MCNPALVGMAVSAGMQANAQRQQGKYQKGVADFNARQSENQAVALRNKGTEEEMASRKATAELKARQRAQLAASGVDLSSGSALSLQEDTETLGEANALRIRGNFQNQAAGLDQGAGLTRSQGAFAKSAGDTAAANTLLSATGSAMSSGVSDKWFSPKSSANATAQ